MIERGMAGLEELDQMNNWPGDRGLDPDTLLPLPSVEPSNDAFEQQLAVLLGSEDWLTNEDSGDGTFL
jgi:hypothetical protein